MPPHQTVATVLCDTGEILVHNSTLLVFEVKSVCELEDVDRFADKVALMRTLHPEKVVDGVIFTMAPLNQVEARCADWDSNWCAEEGSGDGIKCRTGGQFHLGLFAILSGTMKPDATCDLLAGDSLLPEPLHAGLLEILLATFPIPTSRG